MAGRISQQGFPMLLELQSWSEGLWHVKGVSGSKGIVSGPTARLAMNATGAMSDAALCPQKFTQWIQGRWLSMVVCATGHSLTYVTYCCRDPSAMNNYNDWLGTLQHKLMELSTKLQLVKQLVAGI